MARGEPPLVANNHTVRFAYQVVLAAGMRLFGFRTEVCQGLGIGLFVATSLVLFLLVRRLSGSGQGLLAVAFYAVLPLDMTVSTCVLPDTLMTFLVLASCLLYLHTMAQADSARQFLMAVATGLVLGLATSAKEPAAFVGIGFAVHCVSTMKEVRRWFIVLGGIVLGAMALLVLESVGFWLWTGDPLFRLHITEATFGSEGWWKNTVSVGACAFYLSHGMDSFGEFGIHGYLVLVGALLAINRRSVAAAMPLLVCAVLTVYMSIGSGSLTHYVLIPHQPRYFHVVMVMGCAVMGIEFFSMAGALTIGRVAKVAAAVVLVAVSLLAAKEKPWRGTVPLAEWLGGRDKSSAGALVLLETFGPGQALEHREAMLGLPTIPVRLVETSPGCFNSHIVPGSIDTLPADCGIVVDRSYWVTPPGQEDLQPFEQELAQYPGRSFREEKVYGPSWPPYKRWLGIGAQQNMIGRIWWVEPDHGSGR
ncbi:MAG: glycosyltransferase family 39 protein [Patescibacteria group bacterium]|nr:glycosyltransferase family 39 protein [Patescibacteria group bacterium]